MDAGAIANAQARILELCALMNSRVSELSSIAGKQDAQLERLEKASTTYSARLRLAGVRAGQTAYEELLARPALQPDPPALKVQQLDVSEMRVRPIVNREQPDFFKLPRPQAPVIVKRRAQPTRPPPQSVENMKRGRSDRNPEPALLIEWSPLIPSSKRAQGEFKQAPRLQEQKDIAKPTQKTEETQRVPPKRPNRDESKVVPSAPEQKPLSTSADVSKYEKMQAAGVPQGAIEQAMRRDGVDPAILFGASTARSKPPPPPKREVESDVAGKAEDLNSSEPVVMITSGEETNVGKQPRKPPAIPKRTSTEDMIPKENEEGATKATTPPVQRESSPNEDQTAVRKPAPPPVPRRSSFGEEPDLEALDKAKKTTPPPPPKRSSSNEAEVESMPKPPPPPEKKSDRPKSAVEEDQTRSNGSGLASRQAMLASMFGNGGGGQRPASVASPSTVGASVPGRSSSGIAPPKEEIKPPKSLADDVELASAADALQKKLLGGSKSKDLSKYEKMKKAGLPQGAIEHAMTKDGVDPKLLFQ